MQRTMSLLAITLLIYLTAVISQVSADCKTNKGDEIQVVVPFAVPVGVPVAPFAPYFYSYQQVQGRVAGDENPTNGSMPISRPINPVPIDIPSAAVSPPASQFSPSVAGPSSPDPQNSSAAVTHCASCHGGQNPKANLSLEHPETLSPTDRLKAVRAVITGRMPKGSQISTEEIHAVITELTAQSNPAIDSSNNSPDKKN
ncbi:MAG TPA: cytochrome c [Pirellulales bacterium]|nr:cytochrome c [Pirellulales bacterium]